MTEMCLCRTRPVHQVNIRISGHLDVDWEYWLYGYSILHIQDGQTFLAGVAEDDAALYGLFAKLRDLGVTLESVSICRIASGRPLENKECDKQDARSEARINPM